MNELINESIKSISQLINSLTISGTDAAHICMYVCVYIYIYHSYMRRTHIISLGENQAVEYTREPNGQALYY